MKSLTDFLLSVPINEMAAELTAFSKSLYNTVPQIIENWCLVRWCDMNPANSKSKRLRNHWARELKTHMESIAVVKLKAGKKHKRIKQVLLTDMELNDISNVSDIIRKKFSEEGLAKYVNKMSVEFVNMLPDVCSVLAGNPQDIDEYIWGELG